MTYSKSYLFILLFSLPVSVCGQLFPYDKIHLDDLSASDQLNIVTFNGHLPFFGSDTVTLEIYFDPMVEIPPANGWAFKVKCLETWFLGKQNLSGSLTFPVSQVGHYQFITYQDGCFINQYFNLLPGGEPPYQGIQIWGKCRPKPKESKL